MKLIAAQSFGDERYNVDSDNKPGGRPRLLVGLTIFAVTLLGAVLRFRNAGVRQFWGDEVHTFQVANEPSTLTGLWHTAWNAKLMADPPLYYILSFFTAHNNSSYSELRLRSLSLLFGIAAIPMMYLLVKRVASSSTACVAALLISLSTFAIQYAQEHRPYSMLLFLSILFLYCLTGLISGFSWRRWSGMCGASLLLIYTHYFGGFLLIAGYSVWIGSMLVRREHRSMPLLWTAALLLPIALTIAYIPVLIHIPEMASSHTSVLGDAAGPNKAALQEYLDQKRPLLHYFPDLITSFISWRLGSSKPWVSSFFGILAGIGCIVTLLRHPKLFAASAGLFAVGFTLSVAFYEILKFPFDPRRSIFLLPLFIWLIAEGSTAAWTCARSIVPVHKELTAASLLISLSLVGALATASVQQYFTYAAGGWRNETNQADWRGIARFLSKVADKDDYINVPTPGETWLRLHYLFYHRQYLPSRSYVSAHTVVDLQKLLQTGKPMWFILNQPWKFSKDTFDYLVVAGDWTSFYGGWVIFLPPRTLLPEERYIVSSKLQLAAVFPRPGGFDGDVVLSGPLHANLKYRKEQQSSAALLELPAGAYYARMKPATSSPDLQTTLTVYPHVKISEWQDSLAFDEILPGSNMVDVKLHAGEPYLFMQHNGVVKFRFLLSDGGDFILSLRARHDSPGPISLRVFATGTGETERFIFDEGSNRFGIVSHPVRLLTGMNEITVYYDSFTRIEERRANADDEYNSFDFSGWKIDMAESEAQK